VDIARTGGRGGVHALYGWRVMAVRLAPAVRHQLSSTQGDCFYMFLPCGHNRQWRPCL